MSDEYTIDAKYKRDNLWVAAEETISKLEGLLAQVATVGDKMATALDLLDTDYENIEFWQAADAALAEWRALVPQQGTARRSLPPSEAIPHGGYTVIPSPSARPRARRS